jgi:ADP-heptose:LPS heptosyltransferase
MDAVHFEHWSSAAPHWIQRFNFADSFTVDLDLPAMPKDQYPAPWRDRFHLKYVPVVRELPALLRLLTLKPSAIASPQTVLIVNCSLIGDFIVSLPAITEFIREHSSAQIDLLVSPTVAPLARKLRGVRRVYVARSVFNRVNEMGEADQGLDSSYDQVIVLRLSEPAVRLLAKASYRAIRTYLVPFFRHGVHLAMKPSAHVKQLSEFNFEVFGKFGRRVKHLCADEIFDFTDVPVVDVPSGRTVIVHTGSGSRLHLWPVDKWLALLESLHGLGNISFVFVGGTEGEQRIFEEISRRLSFPLQSVIRRYDLLELLMLMRVSDLFVGIDSGPRHLAHLVELPSVSLLGPGPKSFQPLNRNATVIDETECKRCNTFYCPYAPSCVGKIEVETVARACRSRLRQIGREASAVQW